MVKFQILALLTLMTIEKCVRSQKVKYLNGIEENEKCELSPNIYGVCRKISDCSDEYEKYRKNQTTLKVCSYAGTAPNHLICCPKTDTKLSKLITLPQIVHSKSNGNSNFLDYETCRDEFLKYRKSTLSTKHYEKAIKEKKIPLNKENCDTLSELKKQVAFKTGDSGILGCRKNKDGTYLLDEYAYAGYATEVKLGTRTNIAAIGWTQSNNEIVYNCGGSIITARFIVTAAHCQSYMNKQPDTIRVGDRYLISKKDDEYAQQLKIQKFITHPDYTTALKYNDIALIETTQKIIFNKYVVPSCIDSIFKKRFGKWSVAGYGVTEKEVQSNVLLELNVYHVPNGQCNELYSNITDLPQGILDSQFCVKSHPTPEGFIPDTCFGDSGSPVQLRYYHEVFHDDFNTSFLSTIYDTSVVFGIVSFGVSCFFDFPSVYTRLDYYINWMKSVIDND